MHLKVKIDHRESFAVEVEARWLFDIFKDDCIREMRAKVGNVDVRFRLNGVGWAVVACLFADDTALLAED